MQKGKFPASDPANIPGCGAMFTHGPTFGINAIQAPKLIAGAYGM
jgi:hypothetical protein